MANIEITYADETKIFEPGKTIRIGRSDDSTIRMGDKQVSRFHAQINYDESLGAWIFSDLGSANSSFIDGEEVKTKQLLGPQEIRLGFYEGAPIIHTLVRIDSTELDDATFVVHRSDVNETTESQIYQARIISGPDSNSESDPLAAPASFHNTAPVTLPLTPGPSTPTVLDRKFCPRCGTARAGNFCGGCGLDYRQ